LARQRRNWVERPWMKPTFSADGDFELMLTEPFPAYSPAGDRIVISARPEGHGTGGLIEGLWPIYRFDEAGLEIMSAGGTNRRRIYYEKGKNAYGAQWSPKGDVIAFAVGGFFFRGSAPQLALIRPDGSEFHTLTDGEASNGLPSWSPDGKRIVYRTDAKRGRGLVIMSLEDHRITPLTSGPQYDNFPAWSPRGDRILFVRNSDGNYDLYTIKPDGTDLRRLTNSFGNDSHPVWSPDGEWIVFSSSREGFKDEAVLDYRLPQPYGELFAMRADGTGVRQLTDNRWEDATPAWMPEPKR